MPTTPVRANRYPPLTGVTPDVPRDLQNLAMDLDDAPKYSQGSTASRPVSTPTSPGIVGRRYMDTQANVEYLDIGTAWVAVGPSVIADGSITEAKYATGSVSARAIATDAVGTAEIAPDSVGWGELQPGAVGAAEIAANLKPSGGAGAGAEALRAIGSGAGQVMAGNDASATNQRVPTAGSVDLTKLGADVLRQLAPIGAVIEWFRPQDSVPVPTGWEVCDGHQVTQHDFGTGSAFNTPDLRNCFILGADPTKAQGTTGAAPSVTGPDVNDPSRAPGIGGRSGTHKVNSQHTHTLPNHAHGINDESGHTHGMKNHTHGMKNHTHGMGLHTHRHMIPIGIQASGGDDLVVFNPDDSRMQKAGSTMDLWNLGAAGDKKSARLVEGAGSAVVYDSAGTGVDSHVGTTEGPSSNLTGTPNDNTTAAPSDNTTDVPTAHHHGSSTDGFPGGTGAHGGDTVTAGTSDANQENRPQYVGLLRIMKVKRS